MAERLDWAKDFVSYAFCVGDVFLVLDRELVIRRIDGAESWLGLSEERTPVGRPITEFMSEADAALVRATAAQLKDSSRLGPLMLSLGGKGSRRPVAIYLAHMEPASELIHVVILSQARLDGALARSSPPLVAPEAFLDRLPELLEQYDEDEVMVTLLQLAEPAAEDERQDLARHLAALSLGGQSATELSEGRFAVVHEAQGGNETAQDLTRVLEERTGRRLEAASLPTSELGREGSADSMRALVYAVRKFAEDSPDFDIGSIGSGFSQRMKETREQINLLRHLVEARRFKLAWQPIVDLETQSLHHVEALVRFDMRGGSPFSLITFAEEVGMIGAFDQVIIASVSKRLRRLNRKAARVKAAVNLSPGSLERPAFVKWLEGHLERHARLADHLLIEITESSRVSDLDALAGHLSMIRRLGFAVCLDDFGAGLSGFQYLRHLKVDYVKIDGSYVRDAETDPDARAFLHAMVTLCRDLRIRTIGEWVETESQAALLRDMGVDFGQGFLFGAPRIGLPKMNEAPPAGKRAAGRPG